MHGRLIRKCSCSEVIGPSIGTTVYSYARNAIDLFAAQSRIWVKNLTYRCATPMKQW